MKKKENIISAFIPIVLGVLFITMKGKVINIALAVIGVSILISAIVDFVNKFTNSGIIKAGIGLCVLVFGRMFVNLNLYILSGAIIITGILQISDIHRFTTVGFTLKDKILIYLKPAVIVLLGACLLFNQGGMISGLFVIIGILFVIEGILELIDCYKR